MVIPMIISSIYIVCVFAQTILVCCTKLLTGIICDSHIQDNIGMIKLVVTTNLLRTSISNRCAMQHCISHGKFLVDGRRRIQQPLPRLLPPALPRGFPAPTWRFRHPAALSRPLPTCPAPRRAREGEHGQRRPRAGGRRT